MTPRWIDRSLFGQTSLLFNYYHPDQHAVVRWYVDDMERVGLLMDWDDDNVLVWEIQ